MRASRIACACGGASLAVRVKHNSAPRALECSWQAIAKAEAVGRNAARLAGPPTPCVCKALQQDGVAARMLVVESGGPGESDPRAPPDPGVTVSRHRLF